MAWTDPRSGGGGGGSNYQTVEVGGAAQTQRGKLNLIAGTNVTITPVDNAGTNSTDITVAASGGGGGGGSSFGQRALVAPVIGGFTGQNLASTTVDSSSDPNGVIFDNPTNEGNFNIHAYIKNAPATPYHIIMGCLIKQCGNTNSMSGLCFSDGTKYLIFSSAFQNTWNQAVAFYCTNTTTYGGATTINNTNFAIRCPIIWLRIGDNGTNRTYDFSIDGFCWHNLLTEANNYQFTATKVGFYINSGPATIHVISWEVTA